MSAQSAFSVSVQPALRELYRAYQGAKKHVERAAEPDAPSPAVVAPTAAAGGAPRVSVSPTPRTPPLRVWRLRRDGARPLAFYGMAVARRSTRRQASQRTWFELALYLGSDGTAAASISRHGALGVHYTAALVRDGDELDAFLARYDPVSTAAPPRALLEGGVTGEAMMEAAQAYAGACEAARAEFATLIPHDNALQRGGPPAQ